MSKTKPKNGPKNNGFNADFDTFWKEALDMIESATLFFLPEMHKEVDWSIEYKSLEQELRGPFAAKKGRIRRIDKLFRLKLKNGEEQYLLFHVEAELSPDKYFAQRMYEYYTYLRWKYKLPSIVVLGIFVGDKPGQLFNTYTANDYGVHLNFTFPTYTIADQDEVTLLSDSNPFALAVLANLYVIKSKNDPKLRFEFKRKLVDHILEQQLSLDNFRNLLNFAFIFIKLPTDLEDKIEDILYNITINNDKMTHRARPKPKDYVGFIIEARHIMETGKFSKELQDKIDEMERNALKGAQQITEKALQVQEEALRTKEEALRTQEEAQRTQEEAQRTQQEAQRAIRKTILNLHKQYNMTVEQIAVAIESDIEFVNRILSEKDI